MNILVTYLASLSTLVFDGDPGLTAEAPAPPPVLTFNAFLADGEPPSSVLIKDNYLSVSEI
jgi:hypothetical protein